jgi:nitrous oxidase accessory protein
MSKSAALLLVTIFLIACILVIPPTKASPRTIVVPDNYSTIQDAIDNASAGDTIFVRSGTYNENISIGKSINLIGQNYQTTKLIMKQFYTGQPSPFVPPPTYVININANKVTISNFTVENPNYGGTGINSNGNENQINDINVTSGEIGISLSGSNQYISNNLIANAMTEIQSSGSYNQIIGNTISSLSGQILLSGSYNLFSGNQVSDNLWTLIILENANSNMLFNNTLNRGDIQLQNSNSNTIYNNTLNGGYLGVGDVGSASSNIIAGNVIEGTQADGGIIMFSGSNNEFYGNLVTNNKVGLALGETGIGADENNEYNNLFFYNMFIKNSGGNVVNRQLVDSNSFDNGTVGNYWDDYLTKYPNATEVDNSGIGNTPYLVYGNVTDNYPLMNAFNISNVSIQLPTWISSLPSLLPLPSFPSPSPSPSTSPSVPEFPVWIILPIFMIATLLIAMVYFRKRKH